MRIPHTLLISPPVRAGDSALAPPRVHLQRGGGAAQRADHTRVARPGTRACSRRWWLVHAAKAGAWPTPRATPCRSHRILLRGRERDAATRVRTDAQKEDAQRPRRGGDVGALHRPLSSPAGAARPPHFPPPRRSVRPRGRRRATTSDLQASWGGSVSRPRRRPSTMNVRSRGRSDGSAQRQRHPNGEAWTRRRGRRR